MSPEGKMHVKVKRFPKWDNKFWAVVTFKNANSDHYWLPSLMDLARIIRAIAYCEDDKYPQSQGLKGRWILLDFVTDILKGMSDEDLKIKHKIPDREA